MDNSQKILCDAYSELKKYRKVVELKHLIEKTGLDKEDIVLFLDYKEFSLVMNGYSYLVIEEAFEEFSELEPRAKELFSKVKGHDEVDNAELLALMAGVTVFDASCMLALRAKLLKDLAEAALVNTKNMINNIIDNEEFNL